MRKKMLFLALALTALASIPVQRAEAAGYSCPQCVTYSDGSRCCVSCWCNGSGVPIACTDHYCPPEDGLR